MTNIHAERARALVGTRFRPQGRDATTGLDCAGVAIVAFGLDPHAFRRDYRLRGTHWPELRAVLRRDFRRVARTRARPGDLAVFQAGPDQLHLAILTAAGFVHAEARLSSVVETPGAPSWRCLAVYRRRTRKLGSS